MSLLGGSFFAQDCPICIVEISNFEQKECSSGPGLGYTVSFLKEPKKKQIYIANRWGNVIQELDKDNGCFPMGDNPSGVYHLIVIGKFNRKVTEQVQKSVDYLAPSKN